MSEERARRIQAYLVDRSDDMVALLVELAAIESPTDVPAAQRGVQDALGRVLAERGFRVRHLPGTATGGHLFARPTRRVRGRPGQLLVGHTDTVWPLGTLETMPVRVEDGRVRGPGTFDMKSGLVQGLFAIEALDALGLEPPATPVWLINSDEEIGSPESKRWVRLVSKNVARAFVLEPSLGPEGHLKTARKGVLRFSIRVEGRAAHAGLDPTGGASAIEQLAHVVRELHAMTDLDRGTSVNVGVVRGGTRANVIAAEAHAEVDVRVTSLAESDAIERRIRSIQATTSGTTVHVTGGLQIPPLERTDRNRALWSQARAAAARLGIHVDEVMAGGGSDGNTTSRYTATLDGLGPIGDGAHAAHEHVVISSMVERAALVAELLMAPLESAAA